MGSFDGPRTPVKGELAVNLMSKREKEDVSIYSLNLDRMGQFPSFLYDSFTTMLRKLLVERILPTRDKVFRDM